MTYSVIEPGKTSSHHIHPWEHEVYILEGSGVLVCDGKEYPVIFRPAGTASFKIEGRRVNARAFEIVDAPGGKKWPGEVKVYISDDARRIPFRIDITRSFAALQLDLKSIEACGFMQASR